MLTAPKAAGVAAIALAIAFNIPFALLANMFEYPAILRRPAGEVLAAFHAAGPALVFVWYAFMLTALALVPMSMVLARACQGGPQYHSAALGAVVAGSLAGLAQAIGLSRWVFVVPSLARQHADPNASELVRAQAANAFEMLNLWGGVAIGEHIGQILTCAWIAFMLALVIENGRLVDRIAQLLGVAAILGIGFGLGDGLAVALDVETRMFRVSTVLGYMALTGWLIATGMALLTQRNSRSPASEAALAHR